MWKLLPTYPWKKIVVPSGEKAGCVAGVSLLVSLRARPPPNGRLQSAFCMSMTIRRRSGEVVMAKLVPSWTVTDT